MKTVWKVVNGFITGLLILVIAAAAVLGFSTRRSGDRVPTIAGYKVLAVLSGSMEPKIHTGDVIIVKPLVNPAAEVKDGDIITFRAREKADMLITHRVVGTVQVNGEPVAFGTKGDANGSPDNEVVTPEQVVGRYQWRIPYFGYVSSFIRKPLGVVLVVILPGLFIIGSEFVKMWRTLSEAEAAKAADAGDKSKAQDQNHEQDQAQ